MCTVVRSFMPVGQGAFYVEQFTSCNPRINLVFDCGSDTDLNLLHNNIDEIFQKGETIHAVFISHLHEDHINGLEYLLSNYNVKKIYFPLLCSEEKTLTLLYYLFSKTTHTTKDFFFRFVSDPYAYLVSKDKQAEIIYVSPDDPDIYEYSQQYGETIRSGKNVAKHIKGIASHYCEWEIIPFNFRNKQRIIDLVKRLGNVFSKHFPSKNICIDESFDFDYYWKNFPCIRDDVKKAYEGLRGSLNTNSMVVFSGTNTNVYQHFCLSKTADCYHCNNCCSCIYKSGCLYTGDYDCSGNSKFNDLNSAYSNYWNSIGCITIPHHGSKHNYNPNLTSNRHVFCIISAGINNNYQHPHALVMRDLLSMRIPTFWINENKNSKFQTYIYC